MFLGRAEGITKESMIARFSRARFNAALKHIVNRLKSNRRLAGKEFTLAEIMTVYFLTTQRYWGAQARLEDYANILRWVKDCAARPAYQQAMQKRAPEMKLLTEAEAPRLIMMAAGGTQSNHWKK